jgi:acetyltransferase-like isoleucine patch superfamily enzyme
MKFPRALKAFLLKSKKISFWYDEGFHLPVHLKMRLQTFLFQRILRVNSKCKFQLNLTSQILNSDRIKLGRRVRQSFLLSGNCYIQANNGIEIGDNTIFASHVKFISANHNTSDISSHNHSNPIIIGSRCWIGTGSVILPGVSIGDNTIVGANSVVTKSFGSNLIIAGNPAKILRKK